MCDELDLKVRFLRKEVMRSLENRNNRGVRKEMRIPLLYWWYLELSSKLDTHMSGFPESQTALDALLCMNLVSLKQKSMQYIIYSTVRARACVWRKEREGTELIGDLNSFYSLTRPECLILYRAFTGPMDWFTVNITCKASCQCIMFTAIRVTSWR